MTNCTFCKIIRREAVAEILYENHHTIAILDINPIHYGHVLVIPKTHCPTFLEIPEAELSSLIQATKIMSHAIVDTFQPQGFNIFSNNGLAAGQSVFHMHFHITPRYSDDNIKFILTLKKYEHGKMQEFAEKIRGSIRTEHTHH